MADLIKNETATIIIFVFILSTLAIFVLSNLRFVGTTEGCNNDFICDSDRKEDTTYNCFAPDNWDCCTDENGNTVDCSAVISTSYGLISAPTNDQCNPNAFTLPVCRNNNWCNPSETCLTDSEYIIIANSCSNDADCNDNIDECIGENCECDSLSECVSDCSGVTSCELECNSKQYTNLCYKVNLEDTSQAIPTCKSSSDCGDLFDCQGRSCVCEAGICVYKDPGDCACPSEGVCELYDSEYSCVCQNNLTNKCFINEDGQYECDC